MTDEEILEIIDFQHKMSYAVSQSPAVQEAIAEAQEKEKKWREKIEAAGRISEETRFVPYCPFNKQIRNK